MGKRVCMMAGTTGGVSLEGLGNGCCVSNTEESAGRSPAAGGANTHTVVLVVEGLACAHCAAEIENGVKKITGVKFAALDFISKRLVLEVNEKHETQRLVQQVTGIARGIESAIRIVNIENHGKMAKEKNVVPKSKAIGFIVACMLFAVALTAKLPFWTGFGLFLASYLLAGAEVILKSVRNILRGRVFDENLLMTIATVGAFAINEFPEGVAVMLFYRIGEFFEHIAVNRSTRSIGALMDIRPDFANLKAGDGIMKVTPEDVEIGDIIIVKPGEKVPLDGRVVEGASLLDTSALTGESLPREVESGDEVLSGSVNMNGLLTIEVTKVFAQSAVSRILDLVQNASARKAPTENFITRFARYYTPAVVCTAFALAVVPPFVIPGASLSDWIHRALVFLVVSCPCALVLSIPLGFFGGIGAASRNGILVKGGNYLEALNNVDTIVFDKTGTLTKGAFQVIRIAPAAQESKEGLLEYAAYAESYSNHPIALSILRAYGQEINKNDIESCDELSGFGMRVKVRGKEILAGNAKLMMREGVPFAGTGEAGTVVYLAVDRQYAGYLVISDEIKADADTALQDLRKTGVRKLVMLTGDSEYTAQQIGAQLGLDEVHAELLPERKLEMLETLEMHKQGKGTLLYVGDGINDAPVLARADVGVAMGGLGSDAAIEAADIVLMTDEPSKLAVAIRIAKRTRRIVWQNILFALGVKAVVLGLGAGGIATMWEAVFADVGVALIAVINAMRTMQFK